MCVSAKVKIIVTEREEWESQGSAHNIHYPDDLPKTKWHMSQTGDKLGYK